MSNRVVAIHERVRPGRASVVGGFLIAGVLVTAASAQVVYEADMAVTGHVIRQPLNAISQSWPTSPTVGYGAQHPFATHFCLLNTFGSDPSQPTRELYEESPTGAPIYRFDRLTVHIDAIVAEGLISYLVLGSCPLALAKTPWAVSWLFGVLTKGPKQENYDKYRTFVQALFAYLNTSRWG